MGRPEMREKFDKDGNYIEPLWGFQPDGIAFDGQYGRVGWICVTDTVCAGCHKAAMCLHVDQSEGEYYPGTICRECIERLFSGQREGG